ncbi:MAG TPA: ferredoxin reductase [Trebonia sp.]
MARAAVPGRLSWLVATVKETRDETATARTLLLDVPGWPGHVPGQHVAVKLTAADGYSAQRDYSIAGPPEEERVELTVQRQDDGEVSAYLAGIAEPGDQFEVRGPIGGWFAWHSADPRPLLLLAGGSGIVPLMSMIRTHAQARSQAPVRLIYSARTPADVIYSTELTERASSFLLLHPEGLPINNGQEKRARSVSPLTVTYLYTRAPLSMPDDRPRSYPGRITAAVITEAAFPPAVNPAIFACGPSGFVEAASSLLVAAGHPPGTIKTERFGPT